MPRQKPAITIGDVDLDDEPVIVNGERFKEAAAAAVTEELAGRRHDRGTTTSSEPTR